MHAIATTATDSTIALLSKSEISSLKLSSVLVQPGLCGTWSEIMLFKLFSHKGAHVM